jgi:hypothetical protein
MVDIVTSTGMTVTVPDNAINVVSGPYPGDVGVKSYIRGGFGLGAIESSEDASHFVEGLQATLVRLTRPNGTPVWVKASAITMLRFPLDTEIPSPPNVVRSVIMVGGFHQALQEDIATLRRILAQTAQTAPALFASSPAVPLRDDPSAATKEFFAPARVSKTAKKKAAVTSRKRSMRIKQRRRRGR